MCMNDSTMASLSHQHRNIEHQHKINIETYFQLVTVFQNMKQKELKPLMHVCNKIVNSNRKMSVENSIKY